MKKRSWPAFGLIFGLALSAAAVALAQRGDDAGRQSKNGRVEGSVGGVGVTVEFGRPKVKGRDLWGKLVPFGQVWRTGADEATTISFAAAAQVEGEAVGPGTYALFTIPGEGQWTVILNETANQWGAFRYDSSADVLRVTVEPQSSGDHVEAMNFEINGDRLELKWGDLTVPIRISKG